MNVRGYLKDTITVARQTDFVDGDPVFAATVTMKAREEFGSKLVVGPDGNERQSQVMIVTLLELNITDRVWLNGDDASNVDTARRPIAFRNARRKSGRGGHFETFF